jgi:hypothetical protein
VAVRFFVDEHTTAASPAVQLTDDLRRLAASFQGTSLMAEAESRWSLVENAWQLNLPQVGVAVQADLLQDLLFVNRLRRVNLKRVAPALNGYQKGRCFYCAVSLVHV